MWRHYRDKYSLKAEILSISKVLNQMPKGRHKLIIIDESHNLRNREGRRYKAIREYIRQNDSQILLLSATPYNKTYLDLANQFGLFINDDTDLGISPEHYIRQVGGPAQFNLKHADTSLRSLKAFEQSDVPEDWQELMRLYTVRRTRGFIKNRYGTLDPANGRSYLTFFDGRRSYFPDRVPKAVQFPFDPNNPTDQYAKLYATDVVTIINKLHLPRYGLANYEALKMPFALTADEERIVRNLSRAGRRLMGFSRTNLFKRLESSGQSFLLSLARHILRNAVFIHAIENNLPLPIGKSIVNQLDGYIEDMDTDEEGNERPVILYKEDGYKLKAAEVYKLYASPKFIKKIR